MANNLQQYLVRDNLPRITPLLVSDPVFLREWEQFSARLSIRPVHIEALRRGYNAMTHTSYALFSDILSLWVSGNIPESTTIHHLIEILRELGFLDLVATLLAITNYRPRAGVSDVFGQPILEENEILTDLDYIHAYFSLRPVVRYEFLLQFYTHFRSRLDLLQVQKCVLIFCDDIAQEYTEADQGENRNALVASQEDIAFIRRMFEVLIRLMVESHRDLDTIVRDDLDHFQTYLGHVHPTYQGVIRINEVNRLRAMCRIRLIRLQA